MPAILNRPASIPAEWTAEEWDALIAALTRRQLIGSSLALGLLTTCGASAPPTPTVPTTRTVRDAYGKDIVVPTMPQRVVAADNLALPWLLELGLVPVASGSLGKQADGKDYPAALYDLGAGQVKPYSREEPDYELLASLQPDLIVGSQFVFDNRIKDKGARYRTIAPTVVYDSNVGPLASLTAVGAIIGREQQAAQRVKEFESAITTAYGTPKVKSFSVVRPYNQNEIFHYTTKDAVTGTLARLLNLSVLPGPEGTTAAGTLILPGERVREASGEALVIFGDSNRLTDNPRYSLLTAVQTGQVHNAGNYLTYAGTDGLRPLQEQLVGIARFLGGATATPTR
jgi:iron complex transport system substrate-binding protein